MATNDSTELTPTHPLVSVFPADTLTACSQVLTFLTMYHIEDCPSEAEKQGLSIIHNVVKSAIDYEIDRIEHKRADVNMNETQKDDGQSFKAELHDLIDEKFSILLYALAGLREEAESTQISSNDIVKFESLVSSSRFEITTMLNQ